MEIFLEYSPPDPHTTPPHLHQRRPCDLFMDGQKTSTPLVLNVVINSEQSWAIQTDTSTIIKVTLHQNNPMLWFWRKPCWDEDGDQWKIPSEVWVQQRCCCLLCTSLSSSFGNNVFSMVVSPFGATGLFVLPPHRCMSLCCHLHAPVKTRKLLI